MTRSNSIIMVSGSVDETIALARAMARQLVPGEVIALEGQLGAGKTHFVRGLAIGLGHDASCVSSPTFVVMHEYETPGAITLIHVDAYRLQGDDEAQLGIGWDQVMSAQVIVAIEWPRKVAGLLPDRTFRVELEHIGAEARRVSITCPPGRMIDLPTSSSRTP